MVLTCNETEGRCASRSRLEQDSAVGLELKLRISGDGARIAGVERGDVETDETRDRESGSY